jgi:hypothetical protein
MSRLRLVLLLLGLACVMPAAAGALPLPPGWCHAQVNVVGPGGQAHTLVYDRGRVQSVSGSSLTLREADGNIVTIQVAPNAAVRVNGAPGSLSQLVRGAQAQTFGVDGAPATQIQATVPPRLARRAAAQARRAAGSTP